MGRRKLHEISPDKFKVLTITLRHQKLNILPFDRFSYELGNCILDYVNEEKDLGVIITNKLNWDTQQDTIVSKANKQLGLLMTTCHFVKNYNQKRSLYMALVRSLFEHCGEIWAPNTIVADQNFEPIQKKGIKWILNERHKKYAKTEYIKKLYKLDLLPMYNFFSLKKLKLFHRVMQNDVNLNFPSYVTEHRTSRSSSRHKLAVDTDNCQPLLRPLGHSFFPSSIELWNSIPHNIRSLTCNTEFSLKFREYMWQDILASYELEPD